MILKGVKKVFIVDSTSWTCALGWLVYMVIELEWKLCDLSDQREVPR